MVVALALPAPDHRAPRPRLALLEHAPATTSARGAAPLPGVEEPRHVPPPMAADTIAARTSGGRAAIALARLLTRCASADDAKRRASSRARFR